MAKILFVDDEENVVTSKRAILEHAGHTVTTAMSARAAIEAIQADDFDAIITDWRLGDADGRVVVQAAKNRGSRNTPVVVVTAFPNLAFRAPEPLADLYLEKPGDPEELLLIVDTLLKENRAAGHP